MDEARIVGVVLGSIFGIVGMFSAVCAAMDFDFFMNNYQARRASLLLGRDGARALYMFLGLVFFIIAMFFCLGLIPIPEPGPLPR